MLSYCHTDILSGYVYSLTFEHYTRLVNLVKRNTLAYYVRMGPTPTVVFQQTKNFSGTNTLAYFAAAAAVKKKNVLKI